MKWKKIVSVLLTLCMVLSLLSVTVLAEGAAEGSSEGETAAIAEEGGAEAAQENSEAAQEPAGEEQSAPDRGAAPGLGATSSPEVGDWEWLQAALEAGGNIVLTKDISATRFHNALEVPSGVTVTLDLNGKKIDRTLQEYPLNDGYVIKNEGNLTIINTGGAYDGGITGGNNSSGSGGGIYNTGTLTLEEGAIYDNIAIDGAGVYNAEGAVFTMTGGLIGRNVSSQNGGGVSNEGTFHMTGGTIFYNTAPHGCGVRNAGDFTMSGGSINTNSVGEAGGGIYMDSGSATITGGSITGNIAGAGGGGIYVNAGTANVSGGSITGNVASNSKGDDIYLGNADGAALNMKGAPEVNNLFLAGNKVISVTGAFEEGVGITVEKEEGTGVITSGYGDYNDVEPSWYFYSSDNGKTILLDNREAKITDGIAYMERTWDETAKQVVSEYKASSNNIQPVPNNGNMTSGWYYLNKDIKKDGRIESINGDVHLILCDDCTLDVKGLYVPSGKTLTIYGQKKGTGRLYSHPSGGAAIGGYSNHDNGNIVIKGGKIDAYGYDHCAGIGTNDERSGGKIQIYGGDITAKGGKRGAGIGGGRYRDGGTIEIYGGTVNATGGQDCAGIGGGEDKGGGNITINGGIVNATGAHYAAGIGGSNDDGDGGNITINGGTVTAKGGDDAAGIGGAEGGNGGTITINGGTVNVTAGANAAGIGGGEDGDGGTTTITGGDITVKSRDGAAIGGAEDGDGGEITISGGTLHLDSGNGAGIGGGNHGGDGGKITISGGVFYIHAEHGAGIGGGRAASAVSARQSGDGGTIRISGSPTFDITADYGYGIGAGDASDVSRQGNGNYIGAGGNVKIDGGEFTFRGDHIQACFGGDSADFEMTGGTVIDAVRDTSSNFLIWYLGSADITIRGGTLVGGQIHMHSWGDHSSFTMTGGELRIRNHYHIDNESIRSNDFSLGDNVMVKKGEEENAQKPVKAADREKAARGTNHYVTIVTCDHPDASYRILNNQQHRASCAYCRNTNIPQEDHIWKDGKCEKCGYVTGGRTVTFDPDNRADSPYDVSVPAGNQVTKPEDPVKRGYVFDGWYQVTGDTVSNIPFDFSTSITENITLKAKWTTQWQELQDMIDDAAPEAVIVLEKDYRAGYIDQALYIRADKTVTIDLNGHMIDRANPEDDDSPNSSVFIVDGGTLTVRDSGEDGVITGGTFGGVYVRDYPGTPGKFTLESGSISENNSPDDGGGVYVSEDCRFIMDGGSINGNICNKNGGGVYVANRASFTMSGGDISRNGTIDDGTGGARDGDGGGVYVASGASFTMTGGSSISSNYGYKQGGGVYSAGTFNLESGGIRDNLSEQAGGGVYMREGTFAMTGGSIEGNVSRDVGGGGVYASIGTFRLAGGTIRGNICSYGCNGGGVYVANNAGLELSGGPVVDGNRVLGGTGDEIRYVSNDVYLPNSSKKINVTGALEETAMIGVSAPADYTGSGKPFTSGLISKGTAENFFSDNEAYMVQLNDSGEAYLSEPGEYFTVTFDLNDGSDEEEWTQIVANGEKVREPEDPARKGYQFLGWYQVIEREIAENPFDFDTPVTENILLRAEWKEVPDIKGHALLLSSEIGVKFRVSFPDDYETSGVRMEFRAADGRSSTVTYDQSAEIEGSSDRYFIFNLNALELAEEITATLYCGDDVVLTDTYSAMTYIEYVKENMTGNQKLLDLVNALHAYGYYMQASGWKDDKESHTPILVPTVIMDADHVSEAKNAVVLYKKTESLEGSGIEATAFALTLNAQTVINVSVKPGDGVTITSTGGRTIVKDDGIWYQFNTPRIGPKNLGKNYTVTIETNQGTASVAASAMAYVNAILESSEFNNYQKNAMAAYYYYYAAAKNY